MSDTKTLKVNKTKDEWREILTPEQFRITREHGTERVFGLPLSNLEQKWHSSVLGQNRFLPALQNISPYLVLLCLVLISPFIGIVSTLRKKGSHHEPGISLKK